MLLVAAAVAGAFALRARRAVGGFGEGGGLRNNGGFGEAAACVVEDFVFVYAAVAWACFGFGGFCLVFFFYAVVGAAGGGVGGRVGGCAGAGA